jgi:hypothetical protein
MARSVNMVFSDASDFPSYFQIAIKAALKIRSLKSLSVRSPLSDPLNQALNWNCIPNQ